jgi:polysaccharide biosynthesis protein PslF
MRVLLISADYPPAAGGVSDYTYHLAQALVDIGHDVRVVASCVTGAVQDDAGDPRIDVVRVARRWDVAMIGPIVAIVRRWRPELIALQYVPTMYGRGGVAPGIALLPFPLRLATHASIVAVLHELAFGWSLVPKQAVQAIAHRAQLRLLSLGCDRFVVTNDCYAELLSHWVRQQRVVRVIPVGANILPVAVGEDERVAVRRKLGVGSGPLLGSLSALSVGDQPEHLITVLGRIHSAHLALLGGLPSDSPRRPSVVALARGAGVAERMVWTGYLPQRALSQALATLDIYVHTRDAGASTRSTVLATALAHGLPIVAYRGPETGPLFVDGENILLAPPGNAQALADRVAQALASPELRSRLSAGARQLYREHFTWGSIARQYLDVAA